MKLAAICLALPLALAGADALAQVQAIGEPMDKLRACSALPAAERLACLDKLSRDIGAPPPDRAMPLPTAAVTPAADKWIVSETTSPFDYSPVVVATASTGSMQLSIQCRGGSTDLVIASAALTFRGEDYLVSYDFEDGRPVTFAASTPATGRGVAIKGDVVRLLASLPERGEVVFRVAARQGGGRGAAVEGRYALAALSAVLDRMAGPCKWPAAGAPRN